MADNPLESLAEYLDTNLDGVQVYGWAADSVKAPAIVLTPATPFQAPYTQANWDTVIWGVEAQLVVSRSQPRESLRALYALRVSITDILEGAPDSTRALALDDIGTVTVGSAELLQGTLTLAIVAKKEI